VVAAKDFNLDLCIRWFFWSTTISQA